MVTAVEQGDLQVHQRVAGQHAVLHGVLRAGVHRRDVLARDAPAGHLVLEFVGRAVLAGERLEADQHLRKLAGTAGLLLVRELDLVHLPLDGLLVGDLRLADVGLDLELAAHAVHQDVQVQLAHAADHGLAGLGVLVNLERRVLFGELLNRQAQLLLVALGLGLDRHLDHRVGEGHRLQYDLVVRVAERVTSRGVLQPDHRVHVARRGGFHRVLLVGVHLEQLAQSFLLALGGIDDLRPGVDLARVHPHVGELAEERVRGDLERQRGERLVGRRLADDLLVLLAGGVAHGRRHVKG